MPLRCSRPPFAGVGMASDRHRPGLPPSQIEGNREPLQSQANPLRLNRLISMAYARFVSRQTHCGYVHCLQRLTVERTGFFLWESTAQRHDRGRRSNGFVVLARGRGQREQRVEKMPAPGIREAEACLRTKRECALKSVACLADFKSAPDVSRSVSCAALPKFEIPLQPRPPVIWAAKAYLQRKLECALKSVTCLADFRSAPDVRRSVNCAALPELRISLQPRRHGVGLMAY